MKLLLITVAALAAAPALAQTTPSTMQSDPSQSTMPSTNAPTSTAPAMPMTQSTTTPDQSTSGSQPMGNGGAMSAGASSSGDYPMCTRTVRDHCRERSNGAGARLHSTPRG